MKFTRYGKKEILTINCIAVVLAAVLFPIAFLIDIAAGVILAAFFIILWLSLILFFRDPERKIPAATDIILSPADGVIHDIELITNSPENKYFEGANAIRIGIFLSVLDVHINRSPCDFKVVEKFSRPGKFHDARNPLASSENNAVTLVGRAVFGELEFPLIVRQITGAIAKRIVCEAEPGEFLEKGRRYGMIKFGSRTELFYPAGMDIETSVKVGNRVFAGLSILATVKLKAKKNDDKT